MQFRTRYFEAAVMAIPLIAVSVIAGGYEWIGALATFTMTRKLSISNRLTEKELLNIAISVSCARWMTWHVIVGEILFAVYFALEGAWTALVGVALVFLYTLWRRLYRTYIKPLDLFSVED